TVSVGGSTVASGGQFDDVESTMFQTSTPVAHDLAPLTLGLPTVIAAGNQTIAGTIRNFGTMAITSWTLNYSVDGGAAVAQSMTNTIAAGATYSFSHGTAWNATTGSHTVRVWASNLNGGADGNTLNDELEAAVNVATQSVQRTTLLEQFTSSTCGPCASLNTTFAPMLSSLNTNTSGSNVSAVKYHMNWPPPGNDPSYNPDGNSRKSYYGVSGIPDLFLDGAPLSSTSASAFTAAAAEPAFMALDAQATISGNQVTVNVSLTPYAAFTGSHKLHIAVVEHAYDYAASTTNQDEFHYVQRKMLPSAAGTTLSAFTPGTAQTYEYSYTFTIGSPAQGNYNLWTGMDNLDVIAFVQNNSTKEVLQADFASISVGINDLNNDVRLGLYPNPTNGTVIVDFDATTNGAVQFDVYDMIGNLVHSSSVNAAPGAQRATLDLSALSEGIYHVNMVNAGVRTSRKLVVSK
ncbi:MAG: Omp28-related outer membrane protein, partial [Flavobacteriales bacterium]|nr:Omp28-related outer membrane protein [Flavobacteriales bacterium]